MGSVQDISSLLVGSILERLNDGEKINNSNLWICSRMHFFKNIKLLIHV